jgi:hypothetical protein
LLESCPNIFDYRGLIFRPLEYAAGPNFQRLNEQAEQ